VLKRAPYADLLGCPDERVMHELHAGNNDAFAVIFRRYHRLVHISALCILRDAGEAEDLTQSVFLKIYRKVDNRHLQRNLFS
jgi:DNA-directed RNA polymerase specialized sigma24 family protein